MLKKRILLVDDDPVYTTILKLNLRPFDVCIENNSVNAAETARNFKPDLVFLDIIMPEMDGGCVAAEFKRDPALSPIPIVFVSASITGATKQQFCGCECLAKPVSREQILECIKRRVGT